MTASATSAPLWMRLLPRRTLSRAFGWFARRRLPGFLLDALLRWWCAHFRVNQLEMAEPLESYRTLVDFFTRPLRPGVRPQDPDPSVVTSCADGKIQRVGTVEDGTALQVKGLTYAIDALVGSADDAAPFDGGMFHVVYLAPGDYHRFHWPWGGRVKRVRHIPGDLWPVNAAAVQSIPGLFAVNERVVLLGTTDSGRAFAFIPVGALNVGSIALRCLDIQTNTSGSKEPTTYALDARFERGDECGEFRLGSTVVLLLEAGGGTFDSLDPDAVVRVGERIGELV